MEILFFIHRIPIESLELLRCLTMDGQIFFSVYDKCTVKAIGTRFQKCLTHRRVDSSWFKYETLSYKKKCSSEVTRLAKLVTKTYVIFFINRIPIESLVLLRRLIIDSQIFLFRLTTNSKINHELNGTITTISIQFQNCLTQRWVDSSPFVPIRPLFFNNRIPIVTLPLLRHLIIDSRIRSWYGRWMAKYHR